MPGQYFEYDEKCLRLAKFSVKREWSRFAGADMRRTQVVGDCTPVRIVDIYGVKWASYKTMWYVLAFIKELFFSIATSATGGLWSKTHMYPKAVAHRYACTRMYTHAHRSVSAPGGQCSVLLVPLVFSGHRHRPCLSFVGLGSANCRCTSEGGGGMARGVSASQRERGPHA